MPDMVFPNNVLTLTHQEGALMQFNALDSLKYVSNGKINIQLACAEAWKESRYIKNYMLFFNLLMTVIVYNLLFKCILTDRKVVNIWKRR